MISTVQTIYGEEEVITHFCKTCKQNKPLFEFPKRHRGIFAGYRPTNKCKECETSATKSRNFAKKNYTKPDDPEYCCPLCERKLINCGYNGELVLDHDHITGEFRGWICHDCNNALARIHDNPETARRMVEYLTKQNGL